jgi:hypothetical protein
MSHRVPFIVSLSLAVALMVSVASTSALAQDPAAQPKPVQGVKGKLKGITENIMGLESPTNTEILVQVNPGIKVTVEGTAEPDFIQPGLAVQFAADLNAQGRIQTPLEEITICTINDTNVPTFGLDDPTKVSNKGPGAVNKYMVRGTVRLNRNGELTVQAPGKSVRGPLSPTAKVKVAVTDLTWAQPGDEVVVDGSEIEPGKIVAWTVKVTMAKPIEGEKKKPLTQRRTP